MSIRTAYERLIDALHDHDLAVRVNGVRVMAQCPAHDDHNPSLRVTRVEGRVLVHCFGGCDIADVLAAVGLHPRELFDHPDRRPGPWRTPTGRRRTEPNPLVDPDHWCDRAIQQQRSETTADYWLRLVGEFEAARRRRGDSTGNATVGDLAAADTRCAQTAQACRLAALVAVCPEPPDTEWLDRAVRLMGKVT